MFARLKNAWTALRTDPDTSASDKQLRGMDAIVAFTTGDEPKAADYPVGKYFAYWEIILGEVAEGWTAVVRFYPRIAAPMMAGQLEYTLVEPTINKLKPKINALIRTRMEDFKR